MSRHTWDLPWHEYLKTLKEHERPVMPGSPATPDHTLPYRIAYLVVGVLVAVTGSLGSAMVMANTQLLAGGLGVSLMEASWLPVAFVMTNACMNLLLVKFRMQYGLRLFAEIFLIAFVAISAINLFYADYQTTLILRGVAGMVSAAMSSLGILYLVQAFPQKHRLKGLVLGMGLTSLGIPFTRVFTSRLLDISEWHGFHTMELGLAILSLVAVFSLRTPPSERLKVYEKLDFLTFALFAPGIALLCAVLAIGRSVWWFDTAWVGWALIGSIVLLAAALTIEYNRARPLINLHFLSGGALIRLFLSVLLVRIVMAEQSAGITGAMQQLGIGLDSMHQLFVVILAATAAGVVFSALTINPAKLNKPIALSLGLMAVGAFMDSRLTAQSYPAQLYFSQTLLAFASGMFLGPAMISGIVQVFQKGTHNLISFIVLFALANNIAGLAGQSFVLTLQAARMRFHQVHLAEAMIAGNPNIDLRLKQLSAAYGQVIGDPAIRASEGYALLQQQINQQASILASNDAFFTVAVIAAIGCVWTTVHHIRTRPKAPPAPPAKS